MQVGLIKKFLFLSSEHTLLQSLNNHLKILSLTLFMTVRCFSQDLIIKRDSSRIFCKITREDSLTLFYIPVRDRQQGEISIKRSEVLKYHTAQTVAKEERERKAEAERKYREKEKIYETKELKVGMYRAFREFITNSPSITRKFLVEERGAAALALSQGNPYALIVPDTAVDEMDVKGFCDGKNVYYKYQHPRGYCKLEYIGVYSFFHSAVHGTSISSLLPEQLIVVDEQGTFTPAIPKYLKKIFAAKNTELAAQYSAEDNQREKMIEYLIRLNEFLLAKK
jgi:hypothetical protein